MNCLIAFDKFKGALSAKEAVDLAVETVRGMHPGASITGAPLTDGGEGFATVAATALEGQLHEVEVTGPRFLPVKGKFALVQTTNIPASALDRLQLPDGGDIGTLAFVEMASASGYECLSPEQLDPWEASTIGTGELMMKAVEAGARAIAPAPSPDVDRKSLRLIIGLVLDRFTVDK